MATKYSDYQPIYKLVLLTFFSCGIYLFYWEYQTWKFLKKQNFNVNKLKKGEPEKLTGKISPTLRLLGGFIPFLNIFLLYQLFEWSSIYADINNYYTDLTGLTLLGISAMTGVLNLLFSPYFFIVIVLPFALTQNLLNKVIEKKSKKPIKMSFYLAEWMVLLLGLFLFIFYIFF
jgi:hypothetical protein